MHIKKVSKMMDKRYRKGPGRSYAPGYNPQNSELVLQSKPDPRRTRQLLRQNILASKSNPRPSDQDEGEEVVYENQNWEPGEVSESGYPEEEEPVYPARQPIVQASPTRSRQGFNKKEAKGITRRSLLWGLGLAAVGGGTIAAVELGPKIAQNVQNVPGDIEKQLQTAFEKGLESGADQARKEFITALDNLEGVSLQSAVEAAHLTRIAYDVFVSPLVTLAATVTGDFLSVTLRALQTARGWLARIYQDNDTLAALQTVLETWVKQVDTMPKKLQTITDTDLDGAQAYLRSLQHKLQEEQAKLNNPSSTPTPGPTKKK